jgi:hypothetical protein
MSETKREFLIHFLRRRLLRVPQDRLELFLLNRGHALGGRVTQKKLVDLLVEDYKILNENNSFIIDFNEFLRDYVLSARESEYILQLSVLKRIDLITWIYSWPKNKFKGQKYNFDLHISKDLEKKIIHFDDKHISFPTQVIFLVASHQISRSISSGLDLTDYYPTTEFEIVFRDDLDLVEVRGQHQVILDFIASAVSDTNNPLSDAKSIFIGDSELSKKNSLVKELNKLVKISDLKDALGGKYQGISSPFPGSKVSRINVTIDEMNETSEETHPDLENILNTLVKDQDKCRISFRYGSENKKYSFDITKSGGLNFRQYMPEEVVTYIVHKIQNI